jgi:hypothetical protein
MVHLVNLSMDACGRGRVGCNIEGKLVTEAQLELDLKDRKIRRRKSVPGERGHHGNVCRVGVSWLFLHTAWP